MHDVTPETAWFILHRLREAMKREPLAGMLRGVVVADETFIGGKPKNKHQQGKPRPYSAGGFGRSQGPFIGKTAVLSLIDKASGEVRSQVIPRVDGSTLRKAMAEQVDLGNTILHTDRGSSYVAFAHELAEHHTVDHSVHEYVRGDVTHEPRRGLLLTAQAEHRRNAPPRQRRAPAPLPRGVRLPVHDPQAVRLGPVAAHGRSGRGPPAHVSATDGPVARAGPATRGAAAMQRPRLSRGT